MTSARKPRCCLMSYDYEDVDVTINCRLFYSAAGFVPEVNRFREDCELLVVLRGDPKGAHRSYQGDVHVYDYVKDHTIDWRQQFPEARRIVLISLTGQEGQAGLGFLESYVPVMPCFWQLRQRTKSIQRLLHIANFKFVAPDEDEYRPQLLAMIRSGFIQVYGGNWQHIGIHTRPLSYWSANRMLARARCCIGLMYPYQRGKSLSGRMWQAPLNGCHVISEAGTNIIGCPGVLEVDSYADPMALQALPLLSPDQLREAAARFWCERTERLARLLELPLASPSRLVELECRSQLIEGHLRRRLVDLRGTIIGPRRLMAGLRRRLRPRKASRS